MIAIDLFHGRSIGVLGMGRSGLAVARALKAGGARPICWDDAEAGRAAAAGEGFEVADLSDPERAAGLALLVVSPGAPHLHPAPHPAVAAALAAGVALDNDVGLFFQMLDVLFEDQAEARAAEAEEDGPPIDVVCVTGSNGKSTTATLIHHVLVSTGRTAHLGGNIGRAVFDLPAPRPLDVVVLELSSYQLELASRLAPSIAIQLNLSPDHLDRHGGLGGYAAAKRRLFCEGAPEISVVGVDDVEGRFLAARLAADEDAYPTVAAITADPATAARLRARADEEPISIVAEVADGSAIMAGALWRERGPAPFALDRDGALRGAHNAQNAAAAIVACAALGLDDDEIRSGFASFPGLAHRLERLGARADGVVFVNDSKATNADATATALKAFERVRWIAGGRAKEGGITSLSPLLGRVEKAYLYGEAAESFAASLEAAASPTPHERFPDLAAALAAAAREAAPGETVLLSPAAASFDQFPNFEARGETFRHLVVELLTKSS